MERMITHLWTNLHKTVIEAHSVWENATVKLKTLFPLRQPNHDSARACSNDLAAVRSRVVRGGSENHLEHIVINQHKFTEKLLHQFTAQYFMVHPATTRKLHVTIEHLGTPTSTFIIYRSLNPSTGAERARVK